MESLKRFYFNLVSGFSILSHPDTNVESTADGISASNRVSRKVDHYRTHFFNI